MRLRTGKGGERTLVTSLHEALFVQTMHSEECDGLVSFGGILEPGSRRGFGACVHAKTGNSEKRVYLYVV